MLIDDLIATGGTAGLRRAVRKVGADPAAAVFLIELEGLGGIAKLGAPATALLRYPA